MRRTVSPEVIKETREVSKERMKKEGYL